MREALTMHDLAVAHAEWGRPEIARMMFTIAPNGAPTQASEWRRPRQPRRLFGQTRWRKGCATDALGAFHSAAFAHLSDLNEVTTDVYDDTPKAARALRKLGFAFNSPGDTCSTARVEQSPASKYRVARATLKA